MYCKRLLFCVLLFPVFAFSQTITYTGSLSICTGSFITLHAPAGSAYQWQIGGADIPSATSANYIASSSGDYSVMVTISGTPTPVGPVTVVVNPKPDPTFTFNNNNTCGGTSVQFNSNVTVGTAPFTYSWNFGDATTSTSQNPAHSFTTAVGCGGTTPFAPILTVTDANGCSNTATNPITVLNAPDVQLQDQNVFAPFNNCNNNPTPAHPDYTLTVTNISPSSSCITSYSIDWGDGTSVQSGLTPTSFPLSHTYTQLGAFNLIVSAIGNAGCNNSKTYVVANQSNPAGDLGTLGSTTGLCAPALVPFTISSNWQLNSPGTTYNIDFGDGTSVTLAHPLNVGLTAEIINHTYTASSCPSPTYTAILKVINACATTPYTAGNIQIQTKSTASFTSPVTGCIGQSVNFTNSTTLGHYGNNCATLTTYTWDFGDPGSGINNTSTSTNPSHTYSTAGTYTITITALNPCGTTSSTGQVCIITPPSPSFTIGASGCAPLTVSAINTSNTLTNCGSTTYLWTVSYAAAFCGTSSSWSFTGGTNASSINPSFIFNNPGTYTIKLSITNACGTVTTTQSVDVKKPPTVSLVSISSVCGSLNITPTASVTNCGTSPLSYSWAFGNGSPNTSSNTNPGSISFTTLGTNTIALTVTNECGATSANESFTISTPPDVVVPSNQTICGGTATGGFSFTGSVSGTTFSWTNNNTGIGLGSSGTGNIANFTPTNSGSSPITATITVTPIHGCSGTPLSFTITVNPKPAAPVVSTPVAYCLNSTATQLTATTTGPHILWYNNPSLTSGSGTAPTPSTTSVGTTNYYVTQDNSFSCTSNSSVIAVIITALITNNTVSSDQTICSGSTAAVLTATTPSGGTGSYTYQWQSSPDGTTWSNIISNGTSSTYSPGALSSTTSFRRIVFSGPCSLTSVNTVTITIQPVLTNTGISADQDLCENNPTVLLTGQIPAGGNGSYTYQWQSSLNNSPPWLDVTGATLPDYQPPILHTTTYYRRNITSGSCNATASVKININNTPAAGTLSSSVINTCQGSNISITTSNFIGAIKKWQCNLTPANPLTWVDTSVTNSTINFNNVQTSFGVRVVIKQLGPCINEVTSTTVQVNTFAPTVPGTTGSDATVCIGGNSGTISLSGQTGNVVRWETSLNGVTFPNPVANTTSSINYTNLSVTTWYRAIVQNGACPQAISTITKITVVPTVTPSNAGSDQNLCNSSAVTLNGNVPSFGTGSWSQTLGPAATIVNPSLHNTQITGLQPSQTYHFAWLITGPGSCPTSSDEVQVIDYPAITQATAGTDQTVCTFVGPKDSVTLNGKVLSNPTFETGIWSFVLPNPTGSNPLIRNATNPSSQFVFDKAGTYQLTWTISNGVCTSTKDTVVINVFDKPVAGTLTASATTGCVGNDISISSGNTFTGSVLKWQYNFSPLNPNTWIDTAVSSTAITFKNAQQSFTARMIARSLGVSFGCNQTDTSSVPIEIIPDFTNTIDTTSLTVCPGQSISVNGQLPSGAYNVFRYQWQQSSNGKTNWTDIIGQTATNLNFTPLSTVYLRRLVIVTPCTRISDSVYVFVRPSVGNFLMSDSVGTCFPFDVTFTNLVLPSSQTTWNFGDGAFNDGDEVTHTYHSTGTFQVVMTAQYPGGCKFEATKNVVITGPKGIFQYDHDKICAGIPVRFEAAAVGIDSVRWNFGDGQSIITTGQVIYHSYAQAGPYDPYIELLAGTNGTCRTRLNGTDTIFVDLVKAGFKQDAIQNCAVTQMAFTDTARAFYGIKSWNWDFGDGGTSSEKNPVHNYKATNSWKVRQIVTGNSGCEDTTLKPVAVSVWDIPQVKTNNDTVSCVGQTVSYAASVFANDAIKNTIWNFSNGSGATTLVAPKIYSFPGTYMAIFIATTINDCSDTIRLPIVIYPALSIDLGPDQVVATGTKITLNAAITNGPVNIWEWSPDVALTCNNCYPPVATAKNDITYIAKATTIHGCVATDSISIKVFCEGSQVFIPNVFTPDGDGLNDVLMVRAKGIKTVKSFHIFNRWGEVVFERSNFAPNEKSSGWDGTIHGKKAGPDVYVYTCEVICENDLTYTYKGNITLVK